VLLRDEPTGLANLRRVAAWLLIELIVVSLFSVFLRFLRISQLGLPPPLSSRRHLGPYADRVDGMGVSIAWPSCIRPMKIGMSRRRSIRPPDTSLTAALPDRRMNYWTSGHIPAGQLHQGYDASPPVGAIVYFSNKLGRVDSHTDHQSGRWPADIARHDGRQRTGVRQYEQLPHHAGVVATRRRRWRAEVPSSIPHLLSGNFNGLAGMDLVQVWSGGINTLLSNGNGTYNLIREGWLPRAGTTQTRRARHG